MVGFEQPIEKYVKPQKTTSGDFDFTEVDDMLSRDYVQGSIIQMVRNITPVGTSAQEVKVTDGTDILSINADGSINNFMDYLRENGTLIIRSSATTTAGTTTLYTVPAGKKFYLLSATQSQAQANGTTSAVASLQTDADGTARTFCGIVGRTHTASSADSCVSFNPSTALKIPANKVVQEVITGSFVDKLTTIYGYEI